MLFGRFAALSLLLISAGLGCRSAPADRPATLDRWQDSASIAAVQTAAVATAPQPVEKPRAVLARYQPPEPLPAPPDEVKLDSAPLCLGDLENLALQNNPTLAAAGARRQAARGRQLQAGLYPNPSVGYHGTEIGTGGTAGAQGPFVSQRFITGGKLRLDQAAAGREVVARQFEFSAQEQRVLTDVQVRFYEVLVAQRRVELTAELVGIGENLARATKSLLEGRQATQNDLLQAEIRTAQARILLDNARNESTEAWRRLAAVVGAPYMPQQPLCGELEDQAPRFNWDACYQQLLAGHPELNAARARVDRAAITIRRARREPIPNLDVFVSLRHQDATDDQIINVQAGVPLPVFDANQGNIQAAEAEWVAAQREVQRIELELQERLAVVFRRYANAAQQAQRYGQEIVPRAKESLDLVTGGYENGQVEYLMLLTAQQTYLQVSLSQLDALRELKVSSAVIRGRLLTESLSTPGLSMQGLSTQNNSTRR